MIGMSRVAGSALRRRVASQPSISGRFKSLRGREESSPPLAEPFVGRDLPMFGDPGGERRGRHAVAAAGLELRRRLGERVAEVVEGDTVENDAERIGLGAELGRRGSEATAAGGALPALDGLEFLCARSFA
jgi:hypothetical protein